MGDLKLIDTMIKDGLTDAFHGYHMGNTAENVARQWQLTRDEQDQFAVASQNKAEAAQKAGKFKDEIVPVTIKGRKGDTVVDQDEYIRARRHARRHRQAAPAFDKEGTVTAANASGINDGAAAVVLMTEAEAARRGITPLARIVSWATAGVDPADHGHRPDPGLAQGAARRPAGRSATSTSSRPTRPSPRRPARSTRTWAGIPAIVNVNGGAIAIGHPIGASGARVFNTLLSTRCGAAAPRRASPRCASAAAWASPCASRR